MRPVTSPDAQLDGVARRVFEACGEPVTLGAVAKRANVSRARARAVLVELQIRGLVRDAQVLNKVGGWVRCP
jgi:hypothetical protein